MRLAGLARQVPPVRPRAVGVLFALFVVIGLWLGSTAILELRASEVSIPWSRPFFWEMSGALSSFALCFLPYAATHLVRWPDVGRFVAVHLVACALYASLHIVLMLGARLVLYPLLGWGTYDLGPLAFRVPMEAQKDVLSYLVMAVVFSGVRLLREQADQKRRSAELAAELREAQLGALAGQLQPHFLFNALNTVSSLMYEDLARTDRLLADLGLLLRAGLDAEAKPCWSLGEEMAHTQRYLDLMQARMGERLVATTTVPPELRVAQVPRFTVVRLLENSLKHNADGKRPLHLTVEARRDGERLELRVEDDGQGFAREKHPSRGVGLSNLCRSLELLHGEHGTVRHGNRQAGGAFVEVALPLTGAT